MFPEEVEEALKTHPAIEDALVLGVPDEKWGQAVTGVVVLANGSRFDEEQLRTHVRTQLAGYKTPKRILVAGVALARPERQGGLQGGWGICETRVGYCLNSSPWPGLTRPPSAPASCGRR